MSDYYKYCKNIYNTNPIRVNDAIQNNINYVASVSKDEKSGWNNIILSVEGVYCGACVWLIESSLNAQGYVNSARLNMTTNRLSLEWKGDAKKINDIISIIEKLGYRAVPFEVSEMIANSLREEKDLLKRLFISGIAAAQAMMVAMVIWISHYYGTMPKYTRYVLHVVIAAISIPAIIYSCKPFFYPAWRAIRNWRSDMNIPISIGIIGTTLVSIQETILMRDYTYYDAAISLAFVLLIGRYLDLKVRNRARAAARQMLLSQPQYVTIENGNQLEIIRVKDAKLGQIAIVEIGERVPIDGKLIDEFASIDGSIITGETVPKDISLGEMIYAGSINLGNTIKIRIEKLSDQTILSDIIKLIETAERSKAKYVRVADKITEFYVPIILMLSAITIFFWAFIMEISITNAILYGVSVLIVTCPCALALAVPIAHVISNLKLMKLGSFIKSHDALEKFDQVNTIIFDKTGTLTKGIVRMHAHNIHDETLKIIASIATKSKHPICIAIREQYKGDILDINVKEEKGLGLLAKYNNKSYKLGNRSWCGIEHDIGLDDDKMETWFASENSDPIRLTFEDELRPEAVDVITKLKKLKLRLIILSGDRTNTVKKVADATNILEYFSCKTPSQKYEFIRNIQKFGGNILMVGDGLNDAAALSAADISMSPASAIGIAQNSADIIFQKDLYAVIENLMISRYSSIVVKQNFFVAFLYNIITVPVAMCGLITPVIASVAMSTSSIVVVLNSMKINSLFIKKD
ncbi:MAG: heavy metal translocating P-type ATPase [Candidatus Lariskella arthropodorum]